MVTRTAMVATRRKGMASRTTVSTRLYEGWEV